MNSYFNDNSSEDFILALSLTFKNIEKESLSFDGEFAWGYGRKELPKTDSGYIRAIEGGFEFIGEWVNVTITSEGFKNE